MGTSISPVPEKSPMSNKEGFVQVDWLRWFRDVTTYVSRVLNRYDETKSGIASLTAGVVVVLNSGVKATSKFRLTAQNVSGTAGHLSVSITPGTSFTITSTSNLDTRTIFYEITEAF